MEISESDKAAMKQMREQISQQIEESLPEEFKHRHDETLSNANQDSDAMREVDVLMAKRIVEAFLFSASRAVQVNEFQRILKGYKPSQITDIIKELREDYEREGRSFRISQVATGYEMATLPQYFPWLKRAEVSKKSKMASAAALETLAVIAYKQPITRGEVEAIRGVDCAGALASLLEKSFLKIAGRKQVPGRPLLYATTQQFLEHFGLKSLDELPRINEIKEIVASSIQRQAKIEEEKSEAERMKREEERTNIQTVNESFHEEQNSVREKFREIAQHIESVRILKEKDLSALLQPGEINVESQKEDIDKAKSEKS